MNKYKKGSLRVFIDYSIAIGFFIVFIVPLRKYLLISLIYFILMAMLFYSDISKFAEMEKKDPEQYQPHPLKGLILGFLGFSPFILIQLILPMIDFSVRTADFIFKFGTFRHTFIHILLGPFYFFIKVGGESTASYVISSLIIPVWATVCYALGYYGFDLLRLFYKNVPRHKQ